MFLRDPYTLCSLKRTKLKTKRTDILGGYRTFEVMGSSGKLLKKIV